MEEKRGVGRGLNGFTLKWIAIITMLIDHIGAVLYPELPGFRIIGRLAFPIFVFLIVEGFYHTSNLRRYELRLLLFALISEVPFDLAFYGKIFYWQHQNVFFTLLIGMVLMEILSKERERPAVRTLSCLAAMFLAVLLHTDYNAGGIIFILIFYIFREYRVWKIIAFSAANLLCYGVGSLQAAAVFAMVPVALYNGKKGASMKYFFYVFYPVHLLILYLIKVFVWK